MSSLLVGCTLSEAQEIARRQGWAVEIRRTEPPREFSGTELRVVRVRQRGRVTEVLVAAFQTAEDPVR